ncbi:MULTISPECIES: bifunctional diaminohydroxyphosphoribosylaminopyrimidine deaminase/5-amino-6-(5-phosphoribosylamino)uracil reductase RibD [Hydrocarboniphaga]|uniref:Riboflavin biosynthesis protein RibD n=2 Tax=Hydrocarboniphaga effusa TaxID=243629 RepID=I8T6Z7_9GAMM|nr:MULTISPECIES: bifunctional diaminohydroxyphosphoribosylaminopyrimidine deaminase/5-amino-6-(5-phosphoribosylamino)uracil reductase RibD [Hydrocarboniphaga]EIT69478.1 hypothetical protein WQQ_30600 [Hydrocarboniphaga effusa AP103]MDZ4080498.1 bifunctional diaminohydroxyphosphoribosylaminopyrimidine deaminase/5-amino-6-(5-phosphoribosylamino)uracil reductase RibD [Hydrocarboniphaga sp.]
MARALQLAALGRLSTFPNPRVGAVVVSPDGEIAGEGWHQRAGEAHAEVFALRAAGERARGADLYVTLEPCSHHGRTPPCADAVITAGVRRVIVAMRDPNPLVSGRGLDRLRAAGIVVETGVMQAAALNLNRGFVSRMERGRPFVTLKLGASLDGRTATASGESQWITSSEARADVHRLRAEAGAVLTSSETVLADDPQLTVREFASAVPLSRSRERVAPQAPGEGQPEKLGAHSDSTLSPRLRRDPLPQAGEGTIFLRQPDRIVLDSSARVPANAKVWSSGARRFWVSTRDSATAPEGVELLTVPADTDGRVDLPAAFAALGTAAVNEVLVECGPRLAGALLQAKLVDELLVYLAPSLLGSEARGLAALPGLARLDQRLRLRYTDVRQIGPDLKITAVPEEG